MTREPNANQSMGILLRTALLSWLVTSVTLLIFVAVILPRQKQTFLENLGSKAYGVVVSVRDVGAGALMNKDYSSVVDHCNEILKNDPSVEYVVVTKSEDGFSLVHRRVPASTPGKAGWHKDTLGTDWRPVQREPFGGIRVVPPFQRRVYHFSHPFNYKGIEWGWIHVGLSLDGYDASVSTAYHRTAVLAVVCLAFGLLASIVYAERLVRPILSLRTVVQRVAGGDLAARAETGRGDELGTLARSINSMTEALLRRDRILESVRYAAQQFLGASDWRTVIQSVLIKLGEGAHASRAYVFENGRNPNGAICPILRCAWAASGVATAGLGTIGPGASYRDLGLDRWVECLLQGDTISGPVSGLPAGEAHRLEAVGLRSLMVIPIQADGGWWGFLGLDDCTGERVWTEAERHSLRAAADMFSAAIERQRVQDALLVAKETLEQRVKERTAELREQMEAKERAHTELAAAQQRLVETSHQAGMAEVATGVLHNVGNVLNSINVSCTLVLDRVSQSEVAKLLQLAGILEADKARLAEFLSTDPRGRNVPAFLRSLAHVLAEDQALVLSELRALSDRVDHIKQIVATQQNYARVSGVFDTFTVTQLVEDALNLNVAALSRHGVRVERRYENVPPITTDKHKVLQILLNLVRNADLACCEGGREQKVLTLCVSSPQPDRVAVQVSDNGLGIPPENLVRIFSHGFTTRQGGHGFGLHGGALAAKQLGGGLSVHSEGRDKGATFTLELPLRHPTNTPEPCHTQT